MESSELDKVVQDVYAKTHQLWKQARSRLRDHDHGFKILYGPPRSEPRVLIVGLQPGGDASRAKDAELRGPSIVNEYLSESWPLAAELRKRFGRAFLQEAVGVNAMFFRAPSWAMWQEIDRNLRSELEMFSLEQIKQLIQAMKPKQILILGWDTLDLMGRAGFREMVANRPLSNAPRRRRLLQKGTFGGIPAFAIPHPSAAWKNPIHQQHGRTLL